MRGRKRNYVNLEKLQKKASVDFRRKEQKKYSFPKKTHIYLDLNKKLNEYLLLMCGQTEATDSQHALIILVAVYR